MDEARLRERDVFEQSPHDLHEFQGRSAYPTLHEASVESEGSDEGMPSRSLPQLGQVSWDLSMNATPEVSCSTSVRTLGVDDIQGLRLQAALPPPNRTPAACTSSKGDALCAAVAASPSKSRLNSLSTEVQLLRGSVSQILRETPVERDLMAQDLTVVADRIIAIEQVRGETRRMLPLVPRPHTCHARSPPTPLDLIGPTPT